MNLETGSIVGDYQIIGVLGEGGMGKVFKVRNTISDRVEAMKVLLPDLAGEPELADRFLREIKVLASLDHPNIAALRTAVRCENQLLMIMELVEGVSLDHRVEGRLPVDQAVRCISQVLSALGCAHARGVVHRDIKPANMMLTADGTVKLMDFGIAKSAADRKLTMTGTTMGSLYYMSPEQITGAETLDARSDLYSVGVSLYELVTGRRPFDGDSQFAIMSAHLQKVPVPPITIDPSLPPALNDLILLSVSREPSARFQSAEAFRNALSSVLQSPAPAPAVPIGADETIVLPVTAKSAPAMNAPPMNPPPMDAQAVVAQSAAQPTSHRGLWIAIGAVACAGVVAGGILLLPQSKKTAASNLPSSTTSTSAQQPAPVTPTPAPPQAPAADPQQNAAPPPKEVVASLPQKSKQVAVVKQGPVQTPTQTQTPPAQVPSAPAQVVSQPVQQPPVQQQPVQQQPDLSAQRAELQKVRESLAMLGARATSIHSTLQNLQRSQAASGLGMRGDWVQSASLMDSFLRGADDALRAGDAASAKDLMEKGERQVEKLEKALNK
jgi:serine/threonine protein kinase